MTEQKARKVAAAKAVRAVTGKSTATKTGVTAAVKKTTVKKAAAKSSKAAGIVTGKSPIKAKAKKPTNSSAKPVSARKMPAKPTPEERYRMVEMTAYFIAERNGFQGDSTEHWAAAEREIAAKLGQ